MKEILDTLRAGLKKIDKIKAKKIELEAEQADLLPKIQSLTAAVGGGDAKSVPALAIAQARQQLVPTELGNLEIDFDHAVSEISTVLTGLAAPLGQAYTELYHRTKKEVTALMEEHLDNGYEVQEIANKVALESKKCRRIEDLQRQFTNLNFGGRMMSADSAISKAKTALKCLADFESTDAIAS